MSQKKVHLKVWGCQMNVRDSEIVCGLLRAKGYELTADPDNADVILYNTCSVRQHAEERVWGQVGMLKKSTVHSPRPTEKGVKRNTQYAIRNTKIIGIIGCMAQNYKEEIFRRLPHVSFIAGPEEIAKIPELIKESTRRMHLSALDLKKERPEEIYHLPYRQDKNHAYVNISEGCDNFCSYCIVPYVRGREKSRDWEDILKEIKFLARKGIKHITLLGQNVNSYASKNGKVKIDFVKLLELVHQTRGINKISFVTNHPKDSHQRLFQAMASLPKIEKSLHMPLQSGSNRILKLMNRKYTAQDYLKLAQNFRKIVPGSRLCTDIIVGFPSESEKDFQDTFKMMKKIKFDCAYIFKYSPRPHTKAAQLKDNVPKEEKERRHRVLLEYQKQLARNTAKEH
jgi:tRNA-2-methylthio-N6-dimethylallyladenosine synthase